MDRPRVLALAAALLGSASLGACILPDTDIQFCGGPGPGIRIQTTGAFGIDAVDGSIVNFTATFTTCLETDVFDYFQINAATCAAFGTPSQVPDPAYRAAVAQLQASLITACLDKAEDEGVDTSQTNCFDAATLDQCPVTLFEVDNCEICDGSEETSFGETGTGEASSGTDDGDATGGGEATDGGSGSGGVPSSPNRFTLPGGH